MSAPLAVREAELLATSWQLSLRAGRKSPQTLTTYGGRLYLDWCEAADLEPLTRAALMVCIVTLVDQGAAASTARARQLVVRCFSSWLTDEGEIPTLPAHWSS